jgi:hypothetical protein
LYINIISKEIYLGSGIMMVAFAFPGPEQGGGWPLKILQWGTNFWSTTIQSKKMDKIIS